MTRISFAATITEFTPGDNAQEAWEDAVGSWQTIDFTDLEEGTLLSDQYRDEFGVVFETVPFTAVAQDSESIYLNDGFGFQVLTIDFPSSGLNITFETPMQSIAFDHPGDMFVRLDLADGTTYEGFPGSSGFGLFSGWTSDVPILGIEVGDFGGAFNIDDFRLVPIPGPAAFAFFGCAAMTRGGRRMRRD
ncbi:MAG: hypothetical protein AB8G96_13745 [Phycisphaerales bacterium]